MTKIIKRLFIAGVALSFVGCDKDFVDVNTNPYAVNAVDPALLFSGSQRTHLGTWAAESQIVQQFVVPYNTGANLGINFNEDIDGVSNPKWDQSYAGGANGNGAPIKNMMQALSLLSTTTNRPNLVNMIRIWKAQVFMGLVDEYGDVPYSEAGRGYIDKLFYPKYDDDAIIYDDIYKEIKEATAALSPTADYVAADLFYGINGHSTTKTANLATAAQVAKWKKLGYSLMLRLGMRYSKLNATKAQSIVAEAFAGGVMTSNADNAIIKYDGTVYTQGDNGALRNFSQFNYAGEPFVNQLKSTKDPRGKNILANFPNPGNVSATPNPDTVLANQFGAPVGVTDAQITAAGSPYRGTRSGGLNYSQINVWTVASPASADLYVTYAQTSLLLAEAAKRGWIPGGDAQAKIYYDNGVTADMQEYTIFPGTVPITNGEIAAYLADPAVAYNATDAIKLINIQYWIACIRNGGEAFANFRRSTYPSLSPNLFNNKLNNGFARRLSYPDVEASANPVNYKAAATAIGGDKLTSRVFWDIP
jgi:hypothetical protein